MLPIFATLLGEVPATQQTSFVTGPVEDPTILVELRGAPKFEAGGTFFVYQNQLTAGDPGALAQHQQIRLLVMTPEGDPHPYDAELVFTGSACRYRGPKHGSGTDGIMTFERGTGCQPIGGATGQIVLRLRYTAPAHPALLTAPRVQGDVSAIALRVSRFGLAAAPDVLVARGTAVRFLSDPGDTRLALLGYLWQIDSSGRWIAAVVAAAGIAIALVVLLLWRSPRGSVDRGLSRRVIAGFLAAFLLSALYAVLTPPMQAADEPSHFLTLAAYLQDPALASAAHAWARQGHFEEIRFHGDRTFSPADRKAPGQPWTGVSAASDTRGSGLRALWWLLAPAVRRLPPPQLLLTLRLVSALTFAASVALFVFVVARGTEAAADLLALPLFLIPTLPYFAMQMSNYGPLTSAYVALAAAVVIASWKHGGAAAGALLGSAFGVAIIISRSAFPMAPCVGSVLVARVLTGERVQPRRPLWQFWLAVSVMIAAGIAAARWAYLGASLKDAQEARTALGGLRNGLDASLWLAVLLGACGWGMEVAVSEARRLSRRWQGRVLPVRGIAAAAATALLLLVLGSLVVRYPRLDPIDLAHPPSVRSYASHALLACATFLRFGRPDTLTSLTFWGGFGWLDAVLPGSFVALLAGSSGLALVLLLVWTALAKDGRMLVWLACAASGFLLSVAAYAVSVVALTPADLHGRYLLGLYLLVLTIAWSSLARLEHSGWLPGSGALRLVAGGVCLAVHAYSLVSGLHRYF